MKVRHRAALAAATASLSALALTGCGSLGDSPVSNAKANKNPAIQEVNSYADGAPRPAPDRADRTKPKEPEKPKVSGEKAKKDPVGTRNDMAPAARSQEIPAWATAINWAQTKLGHKYVWGGESDEEGGFDCSGLMQAAYAKAGVQLPRVANDQYATTNVHPKKSALRPGDLVFYGQTERGIHHVGLYVGSGYMLHAPNSRSKIRFDKISYMSDYYGATRVS